jgi:hypothetical protein
MPVKQSFFEGILGAREQNCPFALPAFVLVMATPLASSHVM